MKVNNGKKFLSDIKLHSDYLKWDDNLNRYETWEEACESIVQGHREKFVGLDLEKEFASVLESMKGMSVFASQRSLQFRGPQIKRSEARMFNCLGGETRFITDLGVFSFAELGDGANVRVWTHEGRWKNAVVRKYGKQKLQKIDFRLGTHGKPITVRATHNHRWILSDGQETTSLNVGDNLIRPKPIFDFNYYKSDPLERLYWCYGYIYGDGTKVMDENGLHKYSMVRLCGNQTKFIDRFHEMGFKSSSPLSVEGDLMVYTGKYLKTLPDINKDNLNLIQAFSAGYLEADGAKNTNPSKDKNPYLSIQTSNNESINFIKNIFPSCGFFITKEYDLTGQKTNYGIRPKTSSFSIRSAVLGTQYFKVINITEDSTEDVWCLEVEEDHSFTLESGIVTGNCSVIHAVRNRIFQEIIFLLLNGCGVGVSLLKPFVANISKIKKRSKGAKTYVIEDSIEGWADALGVLMSSYFEDKQPFPEYAGCEIRFDYSLIRPKGAKISGGFKAPGHEDLKKSLELIEKHIESLILSGQDKLKPINVYDIICMSSDCVLSGGVRRSALIMLVDPNDSEMIMAKTGNWRQTVNHRARSNNSVMLMRGLATKDEFKCLLDLNQGDNDIGFVFCNSWFDMVNPCAEIAFTPVDTTENLNNITYQDLPNFIRANEDSFGVQFCNLTSINAEKITTEQSFLRACKDAAILGTLQAAYTTFPYLGAVSERITKREALLGVSMTGLMNNPSIFNPELLKKGANVVKDTNKEVATKIGINLAARTTCVKPEGNLSVVAKTASGIHPEHSERYFRIMQLNKESDVAKYLNAHCQFLLEESVWSTFKTDYVVFVPVQNPKGGLFKKDMKGVKHLEFVKLVQENWVIEGTRPELGISDKTRHNVSSTIIVEDKGAMNDYIWDNQNVFSGISFISDFGDKDFNQAPFTSVLTHEEIIAQYGKGAIFASGLIVDGLHYFDNNLWQACDCILDKTIPIVGTREQVLLKKSWLDRAKKFAKNYFKGNTKEMVYCIKDIHLLHKWETVNRELKDIDFSKILTKPTYKDVSDYAALACSGGSCDLTRV